MNHEILRRARLPVIGAPMYIVSSPELVVAQCRAGIVGSFPALNARPAGALDAWLQRITGELRDWDERNPHDPAAPFAVNLIVHGSNARLDEDLTICERWRVPLVITSLGARRDVNARVHAWGGTVLHDVIDDTFARKAIEKGADGLVAVATGAGGHGGRMSPFALLQELRSWFDGPIALSGAIANGGAILAARAAGADMAYIGTPFIATVEANASPAYKQAVVDAAARDIVYSPFFTGVHGNYLRRSIEAAGLDPDDLPERQGDPLNFGDGGAVKAWRDIWGAGQGVGHVSRIVPAADRIAELAQEYEAARSRLALCREALIS